jgi:predicted esterase
VPNRSSSLPSILTLLALMLCCLGPAARTAPAQGTRDPKAEALAREFDQAMQAQQWNAAIEAGEKLHEIAPRGGAIAFNIACCHAKLGDTKASARWLLACANAGWAGLRSFETDSDLDAVRAEPVYAQALEIVKQARQRAFVAFQDKARAAEVLTLLPPNHDASKATPLIIALHGSGGTGADMADQWKSIAARNGAILVCPDALRPLGQGYQWMFRDESDWLVMDVIQRAKAKHNIDPDRVILTGFSQGANTALELATRHPEAFAGVVIIAGHYEPDINPFPKGPGGAGGADAKLPPFALLIGANDEAAQSNRAAEAELKALGIPVMLRIYPGHGHAFPPQTQTELSEALRFVMVRDR